MVSPLVLVLPILAATLSHAADHPIAVGDGGKLAFNPPNITADIGDTITFVFHQKNHSATQAAFASPCVPLPNGFDSGFMPVAPDVTDFPVYQITVNDTKPIWAYCAQPGPPAHCPSGMVFSANAPPVGNTFDAFQAAALALPGGANSTSTTAAATTTAWTSPPPPVVETVTATVTVANSVYTTTYASWEGASPNPTPAAEPATHTIIVGGDAGLVYTPNVTVAAINDIVVFEFRAKNHTVTQSSFSNPCLSLAKSTGNSSLGFDSGFMAVAANATVFPSFNITVNDTNPIWVYCRQPGPPAHCPSGMVAAINPPTSGPNTYNAFEQLALHSNTTTNGTSGSGPGTNSTGSGGSGGGKGNGAGRVAVSAGMSVGVLAVVVSALL